MLYKFAMSLIVMSGYVAMGEEAAATSETTSSPSSSPSSSPTLNPLPPSLSPSESPTPAPSAPTSGPTMEPSMSPTTTISLYQVEVSATQPCCGNASISTVANETGSETEYKCQGEAVQGTNACSSSLYFYGSGVTVSDGSVSMSDGICNCQFTFNRFEFEMPESNETAYVEIEANWGAVSSEMSWGDNDVETAVAAVATSDKAECHRLLVSECNENTTECSADTMPAMEDGESKVAQTKVSQIWRDYLPLDQQTEDKTFNQDSTCFCVWLYDNCPEDTTSAPEEDSMSPTDQTEVGDDNDEDEGDEDDGNNESGTCSLYVRSVIAVFGLSFLSISIF